MGKRRGEDAGIDMQVKRDEYDSDADGAAPARAAPSAQSGGWDRADAATLAKRNIVKRKPRETPTGNPFKGINLLGGSSQAVTKPASLFAKPSSAPQPASAGTSSLFGSAAKPPAAPAATGTSGLFGASATAPATSGTSSSAAQSLGLFSAAPGTTASGLFASTTSSLTNGKPAPTASSSATSALKEVAALNQSFCKWVDGQLAANESALLINGVRKYVNFAQNLQASSKPAAASGSAGAASSAAASASSSLMFKLPGSVKPEATGAQAASAPAAASGSPAASSLFGGSSGTGSTSGLFGSKPDASASNGGLFGSSPGSSSAAGGLFGGASSTSSNLFGSSSGSGGLFGASSGGGGSSSLFGGSALSAGANGSSSNDDNENDEDGQDDGAKEGRTVVEDNLQDDEELVLKVRANVKCLVNKAWESRGNGDLSVIKVKGSNTSMMVLRADSGRVVCTIPLYKGISPTAKEAKKNAMVSVGAIIYKEVNGEMEAENDGKPLVCMIKVKNLDDANGLCDAIKSACPQ